MKTDSFLFQVVVIAVGLMVIPALTQETYILHLMILSMVFAIAASNWNLAIGYGGIFHLAQVPFFAAGGYASAILVEHFKLTPWIGLPAGALAAVVLSIAVGLPSLRVRGLYLALLTFSFQFIMLSIVLYFIDITGGDKGLLLPPYKLGNIVIDLFNVIPSYYMALLIFLASLLLVRKVIDSNIGLALMSLRDSEVYAVSRGVNPYKMKLAVFVISSIFTGVSGAFYVHYLRVISPAMLEYTLLLIFLTSMVLGGLGTLYGPLIGAFTLTFLSESLRATELYRNLIFSALMILILIFLPKGLITILTRIWSELSPTQMKSSSPKG